MTWQTILLCPLLGMLALVLAQRRVEPDERRMVAWVFVAHIAASFALVVYHYYIYGGGDLYLYRFEGNNLAQLMRLDFARYAPEVLNLALQRDHDIPVRLLLEGTPTGTMSAVTAFLMLFVGDSIYGACLIVAFFSFYGSIRLYNAVSWKLLPAERRPVMLGMLWVPSAVFWSAGIVKEAFVVGGLGMILGALADLLRFKRVLSVIPLAFAVGVVALVKPYVFMPLALGLGAWLYAGRGGKLSIFQMVGGAVIAVGGLLLASRFFPAFSPEKLGETIALQQRNYALVGGGSELDIGDVVEDHRNQSLKNQLPYVPLALVNALARPFVFEVRNPPMLLAALEMSVLLWLLWTVFRAYGVRRVWSELRSQPHYMFAAVFVVVFSVAVGLATRNLGTLSRYRVPAMPLFYSLVLGLRARLAALPGPVRASPVLTKLGRVPRNNLSPLARARARARRDPRAPGA